MVENWKTALVLTLLSLLMNLVCLSGLRAQIQADEVDFETSLPSTQSLFGSAVGGDAERVDAAEKGIYELNGYVRGAFYGGEVPEEDDFETKTAYGEASLKLRVRKQKLGDGYAELRFRRGSQLSEDVSEFDLREAYVSAYPGGLDLRAGRQIVAWGRADGLNPTDNISPKNMFARSPDEDDRREGNFLIRSFYNLHPLRFEAIWAPIFSASPIPVGIIPLPPGMTLGEADYPDANLKNSGFAVKMNLETASLDGSVSYFNGYNPFPGIDAMPPEGTKIGLTRKAYRMHVAGMDFSTAIGSFGLRGEFAYREPHEGYEGSSYIPNPDLQYVAGGDKEFGDFSVILQYVGRYVFDFAELPGPRTPMEMLTYDLALKNRMLLSQTDEVSHAVSFRPAWRLMYETLILEMPGLYNFTTEELFIKPKLSYHIADALTITAGGEFYSGPEETLFDMIESHLSALFIELKASF